MGRRKGEKTALQPCLRFFHDAALKRTELRWTGQNRTGQERAGRHCSAGVREPTRQRRNNGRRGAAAEGGTLDQRSHTERGKCNFHISLALALSLCLSHWQVLQQRLALLILFSLHCFPRTHTGTRRIYRRGTCALSTVVAAENGVCENLNTEKSVSKHNAPSLSLSLSYSLYARASFWATLQLLLSLYLSRKPSAIPKRAELVPQSSNCELKHAIEESPGSYLEPLKCQGCIRGVIRSA